MLGLMLMRLLTPPSLPSLPTLPSLTWSVTTYTPTASPHHHTFTAWDFALPTLPFPALLLLLALLCYALHRHEDRARRATYEGIFLHPSVPNARVHIASASAAPAPPPQLTPAPRAHAPSLQWQRLGGYSGGYTRTYTRCTSTSTAASFAASPPALQQSQSQPQPLPLPRALHSPAPISAAPVQWSSYRRESVHTYTRPAPTPAVLPPLVRAPLMLSATARPLQSPAPQHSSLPAVAPLRSGLPSHLLTRGRPYTSPYSHPNHASPPIHGTTSDHSRCRRRPTPRYSASTTPTPKSTIRQLGRSAISKPPAPSKASNPPGKSRPSVYPRRHQLVDVADEEDEDDGDVGGTDAMDIDLPTPPSTSPPSATTQPAWRAQSPCRARTPRRRQRQRVPKKEPVHRVRGGRIVKSRHCAGRDWVCGFPTLAPVPRPRAWAGPRRGKRRIRVLAEEGQGRGRGRGGVVVHVRVAALRAEARGERVSGGRWRRGKGGGRGK